MLRLFIIHTWLLMLMSHDGRSSGVGKFKVVRKICVLRFPASFFVYSIVQKGRGYGDWPEPNRI